MTSSHIPVAALLAVALLAGCSSDDPGGRVGTDADTGRIDQTILDPAPGEGAGASQSGVTSGVAEAAPGNGEIRGTVQDDAGLPMEGALVSRIGSEASAVTDKQGAFRFTNVSAGSHVLRVTPPGDIFRIHEGTVDVVAGRITAVTITLVPVDGRGPGYRPHLHDHWGTRTELPLMDLELDWMALGGCGTSWGRYGAPGEALHGTFYANQANYWTCFDIPDGGYDHPSIVLPGTSQLRFTLSWDDEVDVASLRLSHRSPDMTPGTWKDHEPVAHGGTLTIDLEPEMTDNGHQMFSLWQFRVQPTSRTPPNTILGLIEIHAVMVKGDLPVDPPHEDHWGANTTYVARSWENPHGTITSCCNDYHVNFALDSKRLIPPGTSELRIRLGWRYSYPTQAPDPGPTPLDGEFSLSYKPADLPPDAELSAYTPLTPTKSEPRLKEYVLKVPAGQTDAFYQLQSNWRFLVLASNGDLPEGLQETQHQFRLEVIAHKDPSFT